jgi:heterodisulfide reductase subunit C
MHNGGEGCESPCGHSVWCIERCPPNLKLNVLQKNINHYCKEKIISMKITTRTFMLHVMMVGGLVLEVVLASFKKNIFVVMT